MSGPPEGDPQSSPGAAKDGPRLREVALVAAVAVALIVATLPVLGTAARAATAFVGRDAAILAMLAIVPGALVGSAWLVLVRGPGRSWAGLGLRPASAGDLLGALGMWLLALPLIGLALYATRGLSGSNDIERLLELVAESNNGWFSVGAVAIIVVVAPVAEELFFRGVLHRGLRRRFGLVAGVGLSAAVFSLVHLTAAAIVPIFLLGVVLALIYERSRSLWPCILVHGFHNAVALTIFYFA